MIEPARYDIRTVADIMAIPMDRWEAFIAELPAALTNIRMTHEMLGAIEAKPRADKLVWVDDGKRDLTVNIKPVEEPTP